MKTWLMLAVMFTLTHDGTLLEPPGQTGFTPTEYTTACGTTSGTYDLASVTVMPLEGNPLYAEVPLEALVNEPGDYFCAAFVNGHLNGAMVDQPSGWSNEVSATVASPVITRPKAPTLAVVER